MKVDRFMSEFIWIGRVDGRLGMNNRLPKMGPSANFIATTGKDVTKEESDQIESDRSVLGSMRRGALDIVSKNVSTLADQGDVGGTFALCVDS